MTPEVPFRIAIFEHANTLRQENDNTFRFGKGETLVTSSSWKKERVLTSHNSDRAFESYSSQFILVFKAVCLEHIAVLKNITC